MSKKKSIALVSLSSAGTGGHLSVLKSLFQYFQSKGLYPFVISESDYSNSFPDEFFLKLEQSKNKSELSIGGAIDQTYDVQLSRILNKINPKAVIFSIFFSPGLVKNIKYPCYFVSCRLRDTHQELFFKKRFFSLFKKAYFMDEAFDICKTKDISLRKYGTFENVYCCPPILSIKNRKLTSKRKKIMVTCGGGGMKGSNRLLFAVNEALYSMDLGVYSEITYVTGYFNQSKYELLLSDKSCQYEYIKDLPREFEKSRLVISEAGHNTVNELVLTDTPALLIPGFRLLDNQEFRAVGSDMFGFDWIFPEYLSLRIIQEKIKKLLKRNLRNNNRSIASKLLFKGKDVLLDSLYAEISQ